jgi:uncharacterized protein (TIGR02284 family)
MATMVGTHGDLKSILHGLIELDFDAIEAYRTAIGRLKDEEAKGALTGFMQDHERHVRDVSAQLSTLGGKPPAGPDAKRVLTQGKVVIAGLIGDKAILMAMKSNEDDTNKAYERVCSRSDLAPDLAKLLQQNLEDERRHREWIEKRLSQMKEHKAPAERPSHP